MMQAAPLPTSTPLLDSESVMLVTMRIDQQMFGVPVQHVRDVLREQKVARIPTATPEIEGSINLRGRIVTVINLRKRLKLNAVEHDARHMFVVVEHDNELYSLMVDSVGDVMTIAKDRIEKSPANLSPNWREVATGITRLQDELLVVMDISTLLAITA